MVVGRKLARSVVKTLIHVAPQALELILLPTTECRKNEVEILGPDGRSLLQCVKHAWKPMMLTGIKSISAYLV